MRVFALTKCQKGAYLCPSNDRQDMWLFAAHDEDGSATWGDKPVFGRFWEAGVMSREDFDSKIRQGVDIFDMPWAWQYGMEPTRKAALEQVFGPDREPSDA